MEFTDSERKYYQVMAFKDRLVSFYDNEKLAYILTFYIGNENDRDKFVRQDMWKVLDDNPNGEICFIDHLIRNKSIDNRKMFYKFKKVFMETTRKNFPSVVCLRWNRIGKNKKNNVYYENIKSEGIQCMS